MDIQEKYAIRIKELRHAKGVSQEALAFDAGIDKRYLSAIECGKRNFSFLILTLIVQALGTSLAEFHNCDVFR